MKIIWLASFPRSGNTWLRFLLHNYIYGEVVSSLDVSRRIPDLHSPDDAKRIENARGSDRLMLCKTHLPLTADHPFLDVTAGYIYILRHPKDTLVSFLNFLKMTDVKIEGFSGPPEELQKQALRHWGIQFIRNQPMQGWEHCGTWIDHVGSWINHTQYPKMVYRYEDMLDAPHKVFRKVLQFLNREVDENRLKAAVDSCQIQRLQRLEAKERQARIPLMGQFSSQQLKKSGGFFRGKGKGQTLGEIDPQLDQLFDQTFSDFLGKCGYQ